MMPASQAETNVYSGQIGENGERHTVGSKREFLATTKKKRAAKDYLARANSA